jgi:AcrR family transcriptional regulator
VARYFPAKEGLLFSDRDQHIEELRRSIAERPGREAPATAVIAALRAQPPLDAESRRRLLHSRQAIARSSVLRGSANALLVAWRDAIAEAARARGAAELDARVLAVSVVAVLDDTSERWAAAGGRDDLQSMIAEAFTALRRTRS